MECIFNLDRGINLYRNMAGGHEERDQLEDPEADGRVTL
jgi:hypothetical protein